MAAGLRSTNLGTLHQTIHPLRCTCLIALFVLVGLGLTGCGGPSSAIGSRGGGGSSQQPSEVLYAKGLDDGLPAEMGIYAYQIDPSSGNLTAVQTVNPPASNNTYSALLLAVTPSGKFLYTDDWNVSGNDVTPRIDAYSIGPDGSLTLVSGSPFTLPSYNNVLYTAMPDIAIDPASTVLYALVDGVSSGLVGFQIDASSGALTSMPIFFALNVSAQGSNAEVMDPSGKFLYTTEEDDASASELGPGIDGFSIAPASGSLTHLEDFPYIFYNTSIAPVSDGFWPKYAAIDPTGRFFYTTLWDAENSQDVAGFVRDSNTGGLTAIPGSPFGSESNNTNSAAQAMAMHPSGKFLYFENGDNSISAFAIDSTTGALSQVGGSPFPPQSVRGADVSGTAFAIDPSGNFLYVGSCAGIAIYQIGSNGALSDRSLEPVTSCPQTLAVTQLNE